MRYVIARAIQEHEDYAYRIYITDSLKVIGENTASMGGKHMEMRFQDIINPKVETRTKEDIIESIKGKLGALNGG